MVLFLQVTGARESAELMSSTPTHYYKLPPSPSTRQDRRVPSSSLRPNQFSEPARSEPKHSFIFPSKFVNLNTTILSPILTSIAHDFFIFTISSHMELDIHTT